MKTIVTFGIIFVVILQIASAQQATISVNKGIDTSQGFLFVMDKFFENIQISLAQNDVRKIQLKSQFLTERLIELQFVAEKKPQFTGKALVELKKSADDLADEADLKTKPLKEAVEQNLKNSKIVLEAILERFENDNNTNNDNAIAGLKIAIENQERKIDEIEDSKDKNEIDIKIKGDIAEVKAVINNQEIRYKVATADVNEVLNDISVRAGVSADELRKANVNIEDHNQKIIKINPD